MYIEFKTDRPIDVIEVVPINRLIHRFIGATGILNCHIDRSEHLLMQDILYKISFIFKYVNIHELQLNYGGVDVWVKSLTLYSSFNVL